MDGLGVRLRHRHRRAARPAQCPVGTTGASESSSPSGVGLHALRHSADSVMLSNGVPVTVVSQLLRFEISMTVDFYGHASPDVSREAMKSPATSSRWAVARHRSGTYAISPKPVPSYGCLRRRIVSDHAHPVDREAVSRAKRRISGAIGRRASHQRAHPHRRSDAHAPVARARRCRGTLRRRSRPRARCLRGRGRLWTADAQDGRARQPTQGRAHGVLSPGSRLPGAAAPSTV